MSENNPVIERYRNGSIIERFNIRNKSLEALFASTRNILNDEAFIQLMEDEEFDLKRNDMEIYIGRVSPSMIITLSKAISVKKGYSDLEVLDLKRNFVAEIASKDRYSDFYMNLLDWIWRVIVGVKEMSTRTTRDRATYFTLLFMAGLPSEQASNIETDKAQAEYEKVYEDFVSNENSIYHKEDVLFCLLMTAFMYYEKGDFTNFRYFIMKAKQNNTEDFPMQFVIELLANEMLE